MHSACLYGLRKPSLYICSGPCLCLPILAAGCTLNSQYITDGYATRSVDGFSVALGCYALPLNAPVNSSATKHILTIHADGSVRSRGVFTSGALQLRSLATVDGSAFWVGSSFGAEYVIPSTTVNTSSSVLISSTSFGYRGVTLFNGGFYGALSTTSGTYSQVQLIGGAASVNSAPAASPAPAPTALPGITTGITTTASLVFADALTLYVIDYTTLTQSLTKYTRADGALSSAWTKAEGYPKFGFNVTDGVTGIDATVATGGRGSTGWRDPATGTFYLLIASSAGILKYDTDSETTTILARPCDGTRWNGIALAPIPPSPTPTPTSTPSVSPSWNPSPTSSLTNTPSLTSSASSTGTPTPSQTATPQLCSHPAGGNPNVVPSAIGAGSLLVMRVGSGLSALQGTNTAAREAYVEEYSVESGARIQSIALPVGYYNATTGVTGCAVSAGSTTEGHLWRTLDGSAVLIPCWSLPGDGTAYSSTQRKVVGLLRQTGAVDLTNSFTDGATTFRSVVAADTSFFYLGTSLGLRGLPAGAATSSALSNTAHSFRGATLFNGAVYLGSITNRSVVSVPGLTQSSAGLPPVPLPGECPECVCVADRA